MKLNITQVGSYPPPYGGQSVHIQNLKNFLVSKGHRCYIYNTGANKDIKDNYIVNIKSTWDLILKLLRNDTQLVHVHCGGRGSYYKVYACYIVSKIFRKKLVVSIHSGNFPENLKNLSRITKPIFITILRGYSIIICVNERIINSLIEEGIPQSKIRLLPAFSLNVDLSRVQLPPKTRVFLDEHCPLLSCMGFFEPLYGLELAIDAIATLKDEYPNIGLVVMASGYEKNTFLQKIGAKKCVDHVLVLENLPNAETLFVLSKSNVFLRPTLYDGDAISVREALAIGTPVIASKTDFRPEGTLLFEKGDIMDFIRRINECLIARSSRLKAPQKIIDHKNLQRILENYMAICED
jgi:glycosyltransferase involved in cell wall biosynthesis